MLRSHRGNSCEFDFLLVRLVLTTSLFCFFCSRALAKQGSSRFSHSPAFLSSRRWKRLATL